MEIFHFLPTRQVNSQAYDITANTPIMFSQIVVLYEIYSKRFVTEYFWHVSVPVILRIFEVDMHTSIMCINILQNNKAVAPKL